MNDEEECAIQRLITIVERLRSPDGCPWDKAQTIRSLRPYLLEECHEFLVAIDHSDIDDIRNELGDLLLQLVLYARIYEEDGLFNLNDAAEAICNKLVRRHPHVFDKQTGQENVDLDQQWESIKQGEKINAGKQPSMFEQVDSDLPPLLAARKISEKAARIGLDWPDAKSVLDKVREELDELEEAMQDENDADIEHELGDLIFSVVNLSRHLKMESALALRKSLIRFTDRTLKVETILQGQNRTFKDVGSTELDRLWNQAKKTE